jgi:hypothetical protein
VQQAESSRYRAERSPAFDRREVWVDRNLARDGKGDHLAGEYTRGAIGQRAIDCSHHCGSHLLARALRRCVVATLRLCAIACSSTTRGATGTACRSHCAPIDSDEKHAVRPGRLRAGHFENASAARAVSEALMIFAIGQ